MRLRRIRSDHFQLLLIHSTRNTDSEDFDSCVPRQLCFSLRQFVVDVGGPISNKKYESSDVRPRSPLLDKHLCTCSLQGTCYVSIPAVDVHLLQRVKDAVRLSIVVQVENNIRFVTELH